MLNGASLNRTTFNGAASTILVLATAAFSAEATLTSEQLHTHAASANIPAYVQSVFGADRTQYGFINWIGEAQSDLPAQTIWEGSGNWIPTSHFQPLNYTFVSASAGFDETNSQWYALPDATLGNADWTNTPDSPTWGAILDNALVSDLTISITWGMNSALSVIDRQVEGDWEGTATLWSEPTVTTGGVAYHEGYTFHSGTGDWAVQPELVATFTNGGFISSSGDWVSSDHMIWAGVGAWTHALTWDIEIEIIRQQTADWTESGAVFGGTADHVHLGGELAFTTSPTFLAPVATILQFGEAEWTGTVEGDWLGGLDIAMECNLVTTAEVVMPGLRTVYAQMDVASANTIELTAWAHYYGIGFWLGDAASLSPAGILSRVPAPESRRYKVSEWQRNFEMEGGSSDNRIFEVSAA
jgi:hypothetical protein